MDSSNSRHYPSGHEQALHSPPSTAQKDVTSWPSMKRSPSTDSIGGGAKTCVCSPTTHAGSFRCRLHRNSESFSSTHGHTPLPAPSQDASPPLPPSAAPPSMATTASRTVEAQ